MTAYKSQISSHSEEIYAAAALVKCRKILPESFLYLKQVYPNTFSFVITHLHLTASHIGKKIEIKQEANLYEKRNPGSEAQWQGEVPKILSSLIGETHKDLPKNILNTFFGV